MSFIKSLLLKKQDRTNKLVFPAPYNYDNRNYKIWTCDLCVPNAALYQAELSSEKKKRDNTKQCATLLNSAPRRSRTFNLLIRSQTLYPIALWVHKERKTGFEPATPTMARWCSTTELLPHNCSATIINIPRVTDRCQYDFEIKFLFQMRMKGLEPLHLKDTRS